MLAPSQQATATWPIVGDVPELRAIITDQVATIAANAALLDAYQDVLDAAQALPPGAPSYGTGTATGTSLAVSGVSGPPIQTGSTVTDGALVPAGTVILGQISGALGGNGTYLTNNPTTVSATPLTFTPPPAPSNWPTPNDAATLMLIVQDQLTIVRQQTALLQAYQDLLNMSQTPPPATGP